MYRIQYKGEDMPITTWKLCGQGPKKWGFLHYKYKNLKDILRRYRESIHFAYCPLDLKIYNGERLVVEGLPYKDPNDWEYFRVRFHTNPRETKELVKLIKEEKFNVRTASG